MRLLQLEMTNFRSFSHEVVTFDLGTVLVGANNAGKSTIVEALTFLLNGHDPEIAAWAHPNLRTRGREAAAADGPVTVIGRFGDLHASEVDYWGPAVRADGTVRFGAVASEDGSADGINPAILIDLDKLPENVPLDEVGQPVIARYVDDGAAWLHLAVFSDLVHPDEKTFAGWHAPTLVVIPGPEAPPAAIQDVLRPLLNALLNRSDAGAAGLLTQLQLHADYMAHIVVGRVNAALGAMGVDRAVAHAMGPAGDPQSEALSSILIRFLVEGSEPERRISSVGRAGGGARRAATLGALELYCDPALWPANRPVVLVIEEPEAGLHPALQRQVAMTLKALPSRDVQTVITTHSAVFMDAASPAGIRVVRDVGANPRVIATRDAEPVIAVLGTRPSDVLLGEHFLVVEGPADIAILGAWAGTLGLDLARAGIRLLPANGADAVHLVSNLADIAFPGTKITALFDGDGKGHAAAAKMRSKLGKRVSVREWTKPSIESYFNCRAVNLWARLEALRSQRTAPAPVDSVDMATLKALSRYLRGTEGYDKVGAGDFIAAQMTRDEIDAEVVALLAELLVEA